MKTITARHVLNLAAVLGAWSVIRIAASMHGDPVILAVESLPDWRPLRPNLGKFAATLGDDGLRQRMYHYLQPEDGIHNNLRIFHWANETTDIINIRETLENPAFVQLLDPQHWLLVRGRGRDLARP